RLPTGRQPPGQYAFLQRRRTSCSVILSWVRKFLLLNHVKYAASWAAGMKFVMRYAIRHSIFCGPGIRMKYADLATVVVFRKLPGNKVSHIVGAEEPLAGALSWPR